MPTANDSYVLRIPNPGATTTRQFELVYDASTNERRKLVNQSSISSRGPQITNHMPVDGENLPTNAKDGDRTGVFTLIVQAPSSTADGDKWDSVKNTVHEIKRAVSGAHSRALRHYLLGDVSQSVLRVQLDGATNYTDIPIKGGFLDDSRAYYGQVADRNKKAWLMPLSLTLPPYGLGQSFELKNELASSPHFIEDTDADGLADGWALVGAPTVSIDTDVWLIGGQSQEVNANGAASRGIETDAINVSNAFVIAYCWIAQAGGGSETKVEIYNSSDAVSEASVTLDPGVTSTYDRTFEGNGTDALTWYRVVLSATVSGALKNVHLRITSVGAADIFNVDGAYMRTDTSAPATYPAAFGSFYKQENRYDVDSINEDELNYLDVALIPGDYPALVKYDISATALPTFGSNAHTIYMSKYTDGDILAADKLHAIEAEDRTSETSSGGTWTSPAAGLSGGEYMRFTSSSINSFGTLDGFDTVVPGMLATIPIRVFAVIRASHTDVDFRIAGVSSGSTVNFTTNTVAVTVVNEWELHDLGLLNGVGQIQRGQAGNLNFAISVSDVDNTQTADIDVIYLMPAGEEGGFSIISGGLDTTDDFIIDGNTQSIYKESDGVKRDILGTPWTMLPGNVTNRTIMITKRFTNDRYGVGDKWEITMTVIPRTSHLIGTV